MNKEKGKKNFFVVFFKKNIICLFRNKNSGLKKEERIINIF